MSVRDFAVVSVALGGLLIGAAPAWADGFEPNADMGYAFEYQNWSAATTGGTAGFGAMMHTLTMTDRSGVVMALAMSAAKTNANQYYAEQSAIRKRELFYEYQQVIDEPKEGLRLGLVLGTGSPNGMTGMGTGTASDLDAKLARLRIESDLVGLLGGTLGFHTGVAYFQAGAKGGTGGAFDFKSTTVPLGLAWRVAPLPIPGLVFEPFADFDWVNAISRGFRSVPAHDYGLRIAYYPHPSLAFIARAEAAALPGAGSLSLPSGTLADMKLGSLGAQLVF